MKFVRLHPFGLVADQKDLLLYHINKKNMIQYIKPSGSSKAIRQFCKATYGLLVGACCLFSSIDTFAQTAPKDAPQQQQLVPLKSFQGYYQLPNKVAFIAFEEQDNNLYARQKTNTLSSIPILPKALEILESYRNYPTCESNGLMLPILSNQKMNSYLKEIADLCGITKELTFHIARHTFATTITLSNGVPIETVSKMLGHLDIRTTQHYAKLSDNRISKDMENLIAKLETY